MKPYYEDESVTLWHGDMRDVLPQLNLHVDAIVADPPYGETSLAWDRWPDGWPTAAAAIASSMWCFGSMRMFLDRGAEFAAWKFSQDVVWEKHNGSGFAADRFKRVHELALHWYRGPWSTVAHDVPREDVGADRKDVRRETVGKGHHGERAASDYSVGRMRIVRSVIKTRSMHRLSTHPTEKSVGILAPLIEYACPPGGVVLDPFAGSGSTAVAARLSGRRAVLIEADERYCEVIVRRLAQDCLPIGATS